MSSILRKITRVKNRVKGAIDQKLTPVTESNLLACQFTRQGMTFKMADLTIWRTGEVFYYKSAKNKLVEIKNMFTVAQLVYGKIAYA